MSGFESVGAETGWKGSFIRAGEVPGLVREYLAKADHLVSLVFYSEEKISTLIVGEPCNRAERTSKAFLRL